MIIGRRCVGKLTLIQEFFRGKESIYYIGSEAIFSETILNMMISDFSSCDEIFNKYNKFYHLYCKSGFDEDVIEFSKDRDIK